MTGLYLAVRLQVICEILTSQWKDLIDWSENYQQEKMLIEVSGRSFSYNRIFRIWNLLGVLIVV